MFSRRVKDTWPGEAVNKHGENSGFRVFA